MYVYVRTLPLPLPTFQSCQVGSRIIFAWYVRCDRPWSTLGRNPPPRPHTSSPQSCSVRGGFQFPSVRAKALLICSNCETYAEGQTRRFPRIPPLCHRCLTEVLPPRIPTVRSLRLFRGHEWLRLGVPGNSIPNSLRRPGCIRFSEVG